MVREGSNALWAKMYNNLEASVNVLGNADECDNSMLTHRRRFIYILPIYTSNSAETFFRTCALLYIRDS